MADHTERRIVLLGKTGVGKSATGNTILMRKRFAIGSNHEQLITECNMRHSFNKTREINYKVLDTPGLWNYEGALHGVAYFIQQQTIEYCNEPHVFLLVVDPDDCNDTMEIVNAMQTWFGKAILDHTIVVFTKGAKFKSDELFQSFLRKHDLDRLVDLFGSRMVRMENHGDGRSKSQRDLLALVDRITQNGRSFFRFDKPISLKQLKNASNKSKGVHTTIAAETDMTSDEDHETRPTYRQENFRHGREDKPARLLNEPDTKGELKATLRLHVPEHKVAKHAIHHGPPERSYSTGNEWTTVDSAHGATRQKGPTGTPSWNRAWDTDSSSEHSYGTKPKHSFNRSTDYRAMDADSMEADWKTEGVYDEPNEPQSSTEYVYNIKPEESCQVVDKVHSNTMTGNMNESSTKFVRKPLMKEDVRKTIECAYNAGIAVRNMKESPLRSLASIALIANNEENLEAVRNVVQSEEVQTAVENTWSFLTEAATAVGNFVSDVAKELEKEKNRRERREVQMRAMRGMPEYY